MCPRVPHIFYFDFLLLWVMGYIVPSPSYYPIMSWREKWPSLWASSTEWYSNGVGKGGGACNYVSGIWIPPPIPLWLTINCQISTNQCEAETRANVNKHWKPRAKGNYAITNIISANQHFHRLFWCRYSNSRDLVPSSPSFSCPATREFQRACLRAKSDQ